MFLVSDHNCGSRTYDGHRGTDFAPFPYYWDKMDNNDISVVAVASGVITFKQDNNFDRSCSFNSNPWNAIFITHSDGSVAWYGHFKIGVTTKEVGETVEAGEWLGFVGSSGSSTGPHLHLEIYDNLNNLVDPWTGPCNQDKRKWWESEVPYLNPTLLKIHTAFGAPTFTCSSDSSKERNVFVKSETVHFVSFFRDYSPSDISYHFVTRPNGSNQASWTHR